MRESIMFYTSNSELTTKMRMHESKVEVNSEDELRSFIHSLVNPTIGKDRLGEVLIST